MSAPPPSSQKSDVRPISFIIWDRAEGLAPIETVLFIRPEELTRSDTSRTVVQQTLGNDPWVDSFGGGLPMITISGHTGWKPGAGASYLADATISAKDDPKVQAAVIQSGSAQSDGLARMLDLKNTVYTQWHARRAAAIDAGKDPDLVTLIFLDVLNGFSLRVAPLNFTLRRSRSRPLLAQYQISMVVLDDADFVTVPRAAPTGGGLLDAAKKNKLGLDSLSASVDRITSMINSVRNFVQSNLVAPVQAFMNQTAKLYASVRGAISAVSGFVSSVISVAQMITQAGVNLFRTLAAVASIPQLVKSSLMAVASAYSNILCVLKNALRQPIHFSDYSDLYGSSNCSSTSGGRPISSIGGVNPFYNMIPTGGPSPVSITPAAQSSVLALAHSDPVLAPPSMSAISTHVNTIAGGLAVA